MVVKNGPTIMLINDMDISHLMVLYQQIKEDKIKQKSREGKRAMTGDGEFYIQGLMDMVVLSFDKGVLVKVLQCFIS